MRSIHSHKVNPANDKLDILVSDEPGAGGANHRYEVTGFDTETNPSKVTPDGYSCSFSRLIILFQNGPIGEVGVNGITHEALLAILIDRMRDFQAGPYACRENAIALTKMEEAQMWLLQRTKNRMDRGVEGTHDK